MRICIFMLSLVSILYTAPALAYVGPGAGLTVIGSILAIFAAIFLAIAGFVWYPIRRMIRKRKNNGGKDISKASNTQNQDK